MKEVDKKSGLARSANTLLITMLILISASIIWVVLRSPLNETANQISFYESELNLQIQKVKFNENQINITIKRNPGRGEFTGTSFVVEEGENSENFIEREHLNELEMKTFTLNLFLINPKNITKIKISPIFKLDSGQEMVGGVKDEYHFVYSENKSQEIYIE